MTRNRAPSAPECVPSSPPPDRDYSSVPPLERITERQPEKTTLRRRYTLPLSPEVIPQPTPVSYDPSVSRFENDMNLLCTLLRVPQQRRLLYLATCVRCSPELECPPKRDPYLADRIVPIRDLDSHCMICDLIRLTHNLIFESDTSKPGWALIGYEHVDDRLQVDFFHDGNRALYDIIWETRNDTHIEFFSKEPRNSRNPFPICEFDVCLKPSSSRSIEKIQGWIDDCIKHHEQCNRRNNKAACIPKRLIQVAGRCRLVSLESPVRYAALSYCWGTAGQPSTTKSNVALRFNDLQCEELPQTIQDAMIIIQQLGIEYLWVDSLCIVQDDKEEWATEAAKMADIYSRAYIVLAATSSSNVNSGFLHQRTQFQYIVSFDEPESSIAVNTRILNNHKINWNNDRFSNQPLSKRGWAFQERILASRTVHFLPDEMFFECKSGGQCECGRVNPTNYSSTYLMDTDLLEYLPVDDGIITQKWTTLASLFSERSLTYRDDALPALSGLAQRMLPMEPGRYFAGIWERNIAFQLAWAVKTLKSVADESRKEDSRPRPTFSWVTFPSAIWWPHGLGSPEARPICTLLTGRTIPVTGDTYGKIIDASLVMHGRAITGQDMVRRTVGFPLEGQEEMFTRLTIYLDMIRTFPPQIAEELPRETRYEGLTTAWDWDAVLCFGLLIGYRDTVAMLILQPVPDEDSFERIGLVLNFPHGWFDELSTERTVTIV